MLPDELVLLHVIAPRYGMHPLAYAMTRTASDLGLDMSAWLAGIMVPAQLMIGPGKGGKTPNQKRVREPGAQSVVDHLRSTRKKGAKETLVELPDPKSQMGDTEIQTAYMALGHMSNAVRLKGRKRGRTPSMPDLPPIRGFAGKLVENELARRRAPG